MYARLHCGDNLPQCLAFGTGELGVLWWLGGWHSVPERATYGTEYACRAQKGFLGYATHFQYIRCKKQAFPVQKRYSEHKTAFSGTRRIFKGPQNSRLHRLWTASCPPDASSVRETAPLGGD